MTKSRMILFAAFAATLLLLPGKVAAQWVYATSPDGNLVSVIDPSHNTVARTIPTPFSPGAIAVTPDGQRAYVANNCSAADKTSGAAGTVTVLDLVKNVVLIPAISVGNCPSAIAIGTTANGVQAYVSNYGSDSISIIDVANNKVSQTIQLVQYTHPGEVAFTPDGKTVYVAGRPVTVIDTATYGASTLGYNADFVSVDPASEVWLSWGPGVTVLPGNSNLFVPCSTGPAAFAPPKAFILDPQCDEIYDTTINGISNTFRFPNFDVQTSKYSPNQIGYAPNQIAISSDGSRGYVGGQLGSTPITSASATATISGGSVTTVAITNPGSGYIGGPPAVEFYSVDVNPQCYTQTGHGASDPLGSVPWVTCTNIGSGGLLQPPLVQFICVDYPGQCAKVIPATAVTTISNGSVASLTVTNGGSGYINPPEILLIRQGYTPAKGTATVDANGTVTAVNVTSAGSGYGQPPLVLFHCTAPNVCGAGVVSFDPSNDSQIASIPLVGVGEPKPNLAIAPTPPPNTPASPVSNPTAAVSVTLSNAPVTVDFQSGITQSGFTGATISSTGPSLQSNFQLSNPSVYYDIFTTAVYPAGSSIQVCITAQGVTTNSRLMHFVGGSWVDVTILPVTPPTICGTDTSLSPFAIVQPANLDTIPPTTIASLNPPPNAAGWNNADRIVLLNSTDPDGTVAQITYSESGAQTIAQTIVAGSSAKFPITTEGMTAVSYFGTDAAGNVEAAHSLGVQIDKTPPTVTYNGNAGKYTVDQTISIQCAAVDPPNSNGTPGSGLASTTCQNIRGSAYSLLVGNNTFSAQAIDNAGNVGSGSTSFSVLVTYGSLCTLTKQFVESSANYLALPPTIRSRIDLFVTAMCQQLANTQVALTSQQKAQFIAAYQACVAALVKNGWLTSTQGAALIRLSQAL